MFFCQIRVKFAKYKEPVRTHLTVCTLLWHGMLFPNSRGFFNGKNPAFTQAAQENKPELAEERRIQAPSILKGYYPRRRYILDDTSHGMSAREQLCHWQ